MPLPYVLPRLMCRFLPRACFRHPRRIPRPSSTDPRLRDLCTPGSSRSAAMCVLILSRRRYPSCDPILCCKLLRRAAPNGTSARFSYLHSHDRPSTAMLCPISAAGSSPGYRQASMKSIGPVTCVTCASSCRASSTPSNTIRRALQTLAMAVNQSRFTRALTCLGLLGLITVADG